MRLSTLAACVSVATLALTPTAIAGAGGTSGPLRSGGAAFGAPLPVPDARPIASRLTLSPREITAGDPSPEIALRVRQRGITRVRARIVLLRLPGNRPVAREVLGWVKTGSGVTVRLPAAVKLQTGRYLVRLHVIDPRGRTLRRNGAHPGRARIVVHRPRPAPVAPAVPLPMPVPRPRRSFRRRRPPRPARASSPWRERSTSAAPARASAPGRTGHIHEGQDIMAAGGVPVVAPYAGTVSRTSYQASGAGEYVVLDGADGRDYFFAHCLRRSTIVAEGAAVAAGAPLCQVGATGTTSGATHLHFEIWTVGWRVPGGAPIDPLPELRAWAGR